MAKKQRTIEELVEEVFKAAATQDAAARKLADRREVLRSALCRLFGSDDYEKGRRFLVELLGGFIVS